MATSFRLALAQLNVTVGDFEGNTGKIARALTRARRQRARLVVFPELAVSGYPPEDLLFKRSFVDANLRALKRLLPATRGLTALVGFVDRDERGNLYNAVAVLQKGAWTATYRKIHLPNYGVFDENRYFKSGQEGLIFEEDGWRIGVTVCEDIWAPDSFAYRPPYKGEASLIVNLSASPYHRDKLRARHALVADLARRTGAAAAYLNLVGGQDELVFDGGSFVMTPDGSLAAQASYLEEDFVAVDLARPSKRTAVYMDPDEEVYRALVLGTRDYVKKNSFKKVVIGLSGGIDSALVAAIAVDALGRSCVLGVTMPSRFTSKGTYADAVLLARNLGIRLKSMSIEPAYKACLETLGSALGKGGPGVAEENLQARIRGNYMMALSNKFGHLVLTTGNKSEMATGYCTLYGDMAGGFAVIKDVTKTQVWRLARWRNRLARKELIPKSTLRRAPSAELRAGQKDSDSLPAYGLLDRVLERYIEEDRSPEEIAREGFPRGLVRRVVRMVDRNEYKRRQAPPGLKITPKAFGRDRRMPITNRFGA